MNSFNIFQGYEKLTPHLTPHIRPLWPINCLQIKIMSTLELASVKVWTIHLSHGKMSGGSQLIYQSSSPEAEEGIISLFIKDGGMTLFKNIIIIS